MSPPTGTDIVHAPSSIPVSSAPSQVTSLRVAEPTTTASGTVPGQALYDSPPAGSQSIELSRSQRTRTPTERGRFFRDVLRQSQALSTKIRQTKAARKSPGQGKGRDQGKGKRRASASASNACDTGEDEEEIDVDGLTSSEWIVDDDSDVVPTSDPGELEPDSYTYQSELEDDSFCGKFTSELKSLLKGKLKSSSRLTLKEALKFVRRDQVPSVGATQQHSQVVVLSEEELDGGGGHHLDYVPQPSQKRRFVPPEPGPSKRGRLDLSGTPSTVIDNPSPPPIPKPAFPDPLDPMRPHGRGHSPKARTSAILELSPSPLPSQNQPPPETQTQREDTQTQPEDTQTQPEDTQTQPEDTQTQPEDTQTQPENTQTRPKNTHSQVSHTSSGPRRSHLPPPNSIAFTHAVEFAKGNVPPLPRTTPSFHNASTSVDVAASDRAALIADLGRKFDANARRRARAQAIKKKHDSGSRWSPFSYDEPMEDDTQYIADAENAATGKPRKRKSKAGLNCQPGRPRQIATSAIVDLIAYTIARGPWETRYTNLVWAIEAYERRWSKELQGFEFEPALPELLKEILNRVPGGRTTIKANIRAVVKQHFEFIKIPATKDQIETNVKKYQSLRENFHLKSLDDPMSQYENPALQEAFVEGLFDATHSPCVVHHQYFNPVPVETIAFVLTMIEACICEWRSGKEVQEHLNSKQQLLMYKKHLDNLGLLALRAPRRLNRMRKEWYAAGALKSVHEPEPEGKSWATIRLEDIREDTPDAEASGSAV